MNKVTVEKAQPIKVAVVGHTNTGKTSLIRTLMRDDRFGETADAAGTTRHVAKTVIAAGDQDVLHLFDTPGFEDSSGLLDELEELAQTSSSSTPADALRRCIESKDSLPAFDQEIKVLRQVLKSDVLLYIVDVREPLLGKYRDEVEILGKAAKPIIPVFNFIAGNTESLVRWRAQMAEFNLHAALEFDTVAFEFEAERRLYQKLQSLMEPQYDLLQSLIDYRAAVWQALAQAAARRIFALLVEVACFRKETENSGRDMKLEIETMQDFVRRAEQGALRDVLKIFSFTQVDVELQQLPVKDGEWELDVFSPATLKAFGLNAGATALKGAAAGAGIDLMVGGLSLGTATLLGAALGASLATARRYGNELRAALRGHKWLCVDENTVSILYLRQRQLLQLLHRRGHAATHAVELAEVQGDEHELPKQWLKLLNLLRQHPQWANGGHDDAEFQQAQQRVITWLLNDSVLT